MSQSVVATDTDRTAPAPSPQEVRVRELLIALKNGPDRDQEEAAEQIRQVIQKAEKNKLAVDELVAGLSEALGRPSNRVREAAIDALAELQHRRALPALIQALRDESSPVREIACLGLKRLAKEAMAGLGELYEGVEAGRLGSEAFEAMAAILPEDKQTIMADGRYGLMENIYFCVVRSLSDAPDPLSVEFMAKVLRAKEKPDGPVSAALYFVKLDNDKSLEQMRSCLVDTAATGDPHKKTWLRRNAADIRAIAVEYLARRKDRESFNRILEMLQFDEEIKVRTAAAKAMGEFGDPRAVPALAARFREQDRGFDMYGHPDGYLHRAAVDALAKIGTDEAVEALFEGLAEGHASVWAADFWFKTTEKRHFDAFLRLCEKRRFDPGAGILWSLLRNTQSAHRFKGKDLANAVLEFQSAVRDPAHFGRGVDLASGGKYLVRYDYSFFPKDFACVTFSFEYIPRTAFGFHAHTVLYRKIGGKWEPLGTVMQMDS